MYKKVATDMNFEAREQEVLKLWNALDVKTKAQKLHEGKKKHFTIYDGPPTANGKPHIGHVLTRAIKDIIPRYKRMKGYDVEFKAGWDTHGLPVELEVEKLLGINGKPQIEAYGIEPFIKQCKESVWKYKDQWEQISDRLAYWADMKAPYVTYDNSFIESEWWSIKQIAEKNLLYKGHKIVPYCPRCGTALASHEVAQGYKDVKENTVYVRFKVKEEENTYFVAWTTTPWTLPSNVGLIVNPEAEYVLLSYTSDQEALNGNYYIAKDLASKLFGENIQILKTLKGKDLEYKAYEPLFDYAQNLIQEQTEKKAYIVCVDDYVTLSDGTGIVHCAPAFGEDDARVGNAYSLAFVQLVKEDGTLPADVYDFAGQFCKEADKGIVRKLKQENKLVKTEMHEHNYPFCWRCDTPLIYYARHSWYIRMSQLREELVKNNQNVNWIPQNIGEGRFGNFIAGAVDWALSRERYWGTPLPVWVCEDCKHTHVVGSIEELKSMSSNCPENIELHRPYIDKVELQCPCCQGKMKRTPEVIDCWFDSGAMPFAQYHYPFENKEKFEANFPADFISEALDQTRGWFYSLMAISTLIFGKNPYENVIVLGLVQDKNGVKMSKHKGNVVDPWEILEKHGTDAIRWYFYTNSNPWLPSRFSSEAVSEGQRRFMGTLWNTYAFYVMYADIDGFNPREHRLDYASLGNMDKWILSRLHSLVKTVDEGLEKYDITGSARALYHFLDELSNWYVRRGRTRYWAKGMEKDKVDAYMTLYTVLETFVRLAAPFVPFISEEIYQNLVRTVDTEAPVSVHLCDFPVYQESFVDKKIEQEMDDLLKVVSMARACRNEANMKNRQPLSRILLSIPRPLAPHLEKELLEELNVRSLEYTAEGSNLLTYRFKPQLRLLGKKLGAKLSAVSAYLSQMDGGKAYAELQETKTLKFLLEGEEIVLTEEELLVEVAQAEGFSSQKERDFTVALDLVLTEELIEAGFARELVSKIQTMRKENGFEVADTIEISYASSEKIQKIFTQYGTMIASETLAKTIAQVEENELANRSDSKVWSINGENCVLHLKKV